MAVNKCWAPLLVQKSGYCGRSAAPNAHDLDLIRRLAVVGAKAGFSGVAGLEGPCSRSACQGGKPFDVETPSLSKLASGEK